MRARIAVFLGLLASACASTGVDGEVTGLIFDASGATGGVAGRPPARWRLVEEGGLEICSSADLSPRNGWAGVRWCRDWHAARDRETVKWVGRSPVVVPVREVSWSADGAGVTLVIGSRAAAGLREMPAFRDIVRRSEIAIVLGGL